MKIFWRYQLQLQSLNEWSPMGTQEFKMRIGPPYLHARCIRQLKWGCFWEWSFYLTLHFGASMHCDLDVLTQKPLGHILHSSGVCMWSFMMIGVKGKQLCHWTILPYHASTDGRTDKWMDGVISVYSPNFVAGVIIKQIIKLWREKKLDFKLGCVISSECSRD